MTSRPTANPIAAHRPDQREAASVRSAKFFGYTLPVNSRRRLGVWAVLAGSLAVSSLALAAPKARTPDEASADAARAEAAKAAAQAARAAAAAAEEAADTSLDKPDAPASAVERAREGVVLIERKGKVLGIGSVLNGDGRILTALSNVGHGNGMDARFADGSVMPLKMGHSDRAWDLALLVPQSGRWTKGLIPGATDASQAGASLRTFTPVANKDLAPSRLIVKGLRTMQGADSELLRDAIDLATRFKNTDVGSPIIDDKGRVAGMVGRACAPIPGQDCQTVPFGVPVTAIKAFLRTVPKGAVAPAPWLGIQGVAADVGPVRGVRVMNVHPRSAAAAAGLHGGRDESTSDVIVAVDGSPVMTPEALANAINQRAVGDSIQVLLFGGGKFRQVSLGLTAAPTAKPKAARGKAPARRQGPRRQPAR